MTGAPGPSGDADVLWLAGGSSSTGTAPEDVLSVGPPTPRRPRRRWVVAVAAAVIVGALASVVALRSGGSRPAPAAAPTPSVPVVPGPTAGHFPVSLAPGQIVGLIQGPDGLFVTRDNPASVSRVSPHPTALVGAPDHPVAVLLDSDTHRVWVVANRDDEGVAWLYDSSSLTRRVSIPIPSQVIAAAAYAGQLWVATDAGVYVVTARRRPDVDLVPLVAGSLPYTSAIAVDPAHGRVLAVTEGLPGQVYSIRLSDRAVILGAQVPTGKSSIAVVDGHAWVAGYGPSRHVVPADGTAGPPLSVESKVGPGATVWAGQHVLWVTYGEGDGVSCLDPRTGAELGTFTGPIAPVTSWAATLYSADTDVPAGLPLNHRCPG
jgi:hypothetical protein